MKVSRPAIWLTLATIVAVLIVTAIGPIWLVAAVAAAAFVSIMAALLRWRRQIEPQLAAARRPGEPRPWVELEWPTWTRRLAAGWIALLVALVVVLFVLLLIATVARRLS